MDELIQEAEAPDTVAAIEANLHAYCAALGRASGIAVRDDARFAWSCSDVPFWACNGIRRAECDAGEADATIAEVVDYFAACGRAAGLAWIVGPRTRPRDLGQHLARRGFALQQQMPGMAADLRALPEAVVSPADLTIEEADDAGALGEWVGVIVANSGRPAAFGTLLLEAHATLATDPGRRWRHFLARLDGHPVGTALGFGAAGVVGVYWVATLTEYRGRGIGAALTLAPLRAARGGYRVGILHASPLGLPVYRRLGFEERCTFDFWSHHG